MRAQLCVRVCVRVHMHVCASALLLDQGAVSSATFILSCLPRPAPLTGSTLASSVDFLASCLGLLLEGTHVHMFTSHAMTPTRFPFLCCFPLSSPLPSLTLSYFPSLPPSLSAPISLKIQPDVWERLFKKSQKKKRNLRKRCRPADLHPTTTLDQSHPSSLHPSTSSVPLGESQAREGGDFVVTEAAGDLSREGRDMLMDVRCEGGRVGGEEEEEEEEGEEEEVENSLADAVKELEGENKESISQPTPESLLPVSL